jgi:rhamnosyltransferase
MVSVIIPTFNAGTYINRLISSLREQSIECEIIIIDSSSLDKTIGIVKSGDSKKVTIRKEDFSHGKTRNLGVQITKSDIVVFLTQDALPMDMQCLKNLIKPLECFQVVASFGRQIPRADSSPIEKFARLFNYPDTPAVKGLEDIPRLGIKTFFFSNVCSAIKTKEFKELGGFPENIIMFEDLIFAAKAILKGYKIAYVPDAKVWHSHNFSLVQQFRRYQDAGISLRNNAWIFEHTKANREGVEFLKRQIVYLSRNRQYQWIPYAITESVFKYAGFWLGLHGVNQRKKTIISSSPSQNA